MQMYAYTYMYSFTAFSQFVRMTKTHIKTIITRHSREWAYCA